MKQYREGELERVEDAEIADCASTHGHWATGHGNLGACQFQQSHQCDTDTWCGDLEHQHVCRPGAVTGNDETMMAETNQAECYRLDQQHVAAK